MSLYWINIFGNLHEAGSTLGMVSFILGVFLYTVGPTFSDGNDEARDMGRDIMSLGLTLIIVGFMGFAAYIFIPSGDALMQIYWRP